ncbi:GAF domain protein [Desulfovibrionales bacterium]
MNQNTALEHILTIVVSVFNAYSAVLFLAGQADETFHIAGYFSLDDLVKRQAVIHPGQGLVGWILRNQQSLLINNFDHKRNILDYYAKRDVSKIKAFMGCPLPDGQGALCLDSKRNYSFSDKDQKTLQLFTGLISDIYQQRQSVDENRQISNLYRSLNELLLMHRSHTRWSDYLQYFLAGAAQATGFSYSFFLAQDDTGTTYNIEGYNQQLVNIGGDQLEFPIGSGLAGWIFRNNSPVYIGKEDSTADISPLFGLSATTPTFKSLICLPLTVHKKTRGVLGWASEEPLELTKEIRNYTRMAGEHLALFLENLYMRGLLYTHSQAIEK